MGPIVDRSREYLGTSDEAIIEMRKMMLDATYAVERGEDPPGVAPESYRDVRPYDTICAAGIDWREAFADERVYVMIEYDDTRMLVGTRTMGMFL